jgi:DNA-binding MarR family transcriptional regulator
MTEPWSVEPGPDRVDRVSREAYEAAPPRPAVPPIPSVIRLWSSVAAAHAAFDRAIDRGDGSCHVAGSEVIGVLLPLAQAPAQRLRLGELAERANLTPSGMTRRLDGLEAQGVVRRADCAADRRGAYAELTPRGLDELIGALAHHAGVLSRALGDLDEHAIGRLAELLEDVAAHVSPDRPPAAGERGIVSAAVKAPAMNAPDATEPPESADLHQS